MKNVDSNQTVRIVQSDLDLYYPQQSLISSIQTPKELEVMIREIYKDAFFVFVLSRSSGDLMLTVPIARMEFPLLYYQNADDLSFLTSGCLCAYAFFKGKTCVMENS